MNTNARLSAFYSGALPAGVSPKVVIDTGRLLFPVRVVRLITDTENTTQNEPVLEAGGRSAHLEA